MDANRRPSGIEGLGDMSWGTHFCIFYETKEDLLDFFIPFLKAGLEQQEFCLWVASEPLIAEEAERAMRQAIPDFKRYVAEGQLEITPHKDWYLKDGYFDEQRVLQGWMDRLNRALAKGFSGVRVAANFLLEKRDWENFAQYEGKLEESLHDLQIEVLCAYSLNRYSAANMLDVIRHHQFTLARRDGTWEPFESAQLKRAHDEVLKLNAELEQRVTQRTAQLAAANEQLRREIDERNKSETHLQGSIEAADIVLWERDLPSGRLTWLGHSENVFGLAPGEFDGTLASFEELVHPEDIEGLRKVRQRALEQRSEYSYEYRVVWLDDSIHWIRAQGRFIYNEVGQPVRLHGAALDITERKQAEEALRKSERVLREAEALGHTGSWEQNLITGEIFHTEENLRLFFGDNHDEGTSFEDYSQVVHPDDREYVMRRRAELLEDGPSDIEYRVVWPDGSVHVIFGRATVVRDESGKAIRVYGTNVDITERKQAETTIRSLLQISENLHRNLDVDKLLESLIIEAMKLTDSKLGWVGLPTEKGMTLIRHISHNFEALPFEYTWAPGVGWPGWVLVHKTPYISNDAGSDNVIVPEIREQFGVKSGIDTPILDAEGNILGFFEVNNKQTNGGYNERDVEILMAVSRIASIALQNAMSYANLERTKEELKKQAARSETLARIAARLNKQLDLNAVIDAVCQEVVDTFKVSQATMSLYDPKSDLLVYAGGVNIPPEYANKIEPIRRTQFEEFVRTLGPVVVVPDIQALPNVPNADFSARFDVRTVVTADVRRDRESIGVLALGVNGHVREFDPEELSLLKAVSNQAAQAIANAQLLSTANEQREELRNLSAKLVQVQEAERRAITTELHDRVGQNLTGLSIAIQNMKASLSNQSQETVTAEINDAQTLLEDTTRHIRDIMAELYLPELEDHGLAAALETYADRVASRANLDLVVDLPETPLRLSSDIRVALFRAAQEAISNVLKHADATQLEISLQRENGRVRLRVEDNGQGFEPSSGSPKEMPSWGLKIMRERIESIGGKVQIESKPGAGTRLTFEIERSS